MTTHTITLTYEATYPEGFSQAHNAATRVAEAIKLTEPDADIVDLSVTTFENDVRVEALL